MLRTVFKPQMDKTFCHVQIRQNPGTLHSLNHATPKWNLKISKECTRLRHPSLTSPKWVGQLKDSSTAAIYHQTQEKETYFGGSHDFAHSSQHLLLQLHMIHLLGTTTSNTIKRIQVHHLYLTPPHSPTEANGSSLTHSPHPHPPPNPSSTSTNKIPPSHSPGDQLCRFPYGEVSQDPSHPILASIPLHPTPRYQPPDIILPTSITPHSLPYSPPPTSQFSPLQATNSLGLQGPRNDNSWNI